jgi:hypothetical protein
MTQIENSTFDTLMTKVMDEDVYCAWDAENSIYVTEIMFKALTKYLAKRRDDDTSKDYACVIHAEFDKPETPVIFYEYLKKSGEPGNYYYSLTMGLNNFKPKDENTVVIDLSSSNCDEAFEFISNVTERGEGREGFVFNVKENDGILNMYQLLKGIALTIKAFVRDLAPTGEKDIHFKDILDLTWNVDDEGKMQITMTGTGSLKQLIKNDELADKNEEPTTTVFDA